MNISELEQILSKVLRHDKRKINCLCELIQGLYLARSSNLSLVARAIRHKSKIPSRYRRLQRFFNSFTIDAADCAAIVMNAFDWGNQKPYLLIDRTEWEYGQTRINILMLAVAYKRTAIPLVWTLLPTGGNSSVKARAALLKVLFARIGIERFGGILADREFVGKEWFMNLMELQLPFYIRVKADANTQNERGQSVQISWLFHHLKWGEQKALFGRRHIYGHDLKVWGARSPVDGELMIVASNQDDHNNIEEYLQRWDIETLFGSLKSKGFDFEATHMVHPDKISRLIFVLTLAYLWAFKTGLFIHQRIKVIPLKKQGRNLYSLFRTGMDFLCEAIFTLSFRAIRFALKVFSSKHPPPVRNKQISYLRSFVVY